MDRNDTIKRIKTALQRRSGKTWSVTGGKGTAWGWITITAPSKRRTIHSRTKAGNFLGRPEDYELTDTGEPGGYMTDNDKKELAGLLDLPEILDQGEMIPSGNDYYQEYIDRAEGRTPQKYGQPYWD